VFESFIYSTFACIYYACTRDPNAIVASLLLNSSSSFCAFASATFSVSVASSYLGSLSFPGSVSEKAKTASFSSCSDLASGDTSFSKAAVTSETLSPAAKIYENANISSVFDLAILSFVSSYEACT